MANPNIGGKGKAFNGENFNFSHTGNHLIDDMQCAMAVPFLTYLEEQHTGN